MKATHVTSLSHFLVGYVVEILDLQYPSKTSLLEHIDLLGGDSCCFAGVTCVDSHRNYNGGNEGHLDLEGDWWQRSDILHLLENS